MRNFRCYNHLRWRKTHHGYQLLADKSTTLIHYLGDEKVAADFRDIRMWCHRHGAPAEDITVYSDSMFQLFHSPNTEEYERRLEEQQDIHVWDAAFEAYYMAEILSGP